VVVPWVDQVLILVVRTSSDGPAYPEMIKEMDRELNNIIEDFDCAMNFEALRLANKTRKLSFSQYVGS